ncbi:restriction endonuclease subunit S [Pseudoalteromonas sp.]|uniref:restriction endonuclease subunit S n=1 Tax=Pseudoalteromonas sp. TaxID=53249 RepID=UPI00300354C3
MEENTVLGDYISTQKGFAFKSKWFVDSGRKIVKVSDFTEDSVCPTNLMNISTELGEQYSRYSLAVGDVVIQTVGSWPSNPASVVGKTVRVPKSVDGALLNQNAVKIVPKEDICIGFLYYLLRSEDFKEYIIGTAQGAASQASITLEAIKRFKFRLPALEVQESIASKLENYDNLIENNNRRIAILEDMAQSLYREWFVNFRYPNYEENLDADGNPKLIDSPLGQIPDGWEVKTLKDVLELAYGKALKKADRKGGDVAVYGSGGVGGYHDKALVDGPCIIVGRKGNVGKTFWVDQDCWPIDTVFYVKSELSKLYLYYNLLHQRFFNSDAAVPGLNRESAYSNKIIIPSADLVAEFDDFIRPIFKQKNAIAKAKNNLKQQRDMLLPKLISGQIEL